MNKITEKEYRRQIFFCLHRDLKGARSVYLTEWIAQTCLGIIEHPERKDYYRRALNHIMKEMNVFTDNEDKPDADAIDRLIDYIMAQPMVAALIMKHSADLNSYLKPTEAEKEKAKDCI